MRNPLPIIAVLAVMLLAASGPGGILAPPDPPPFDLPVKPISELPLELRQRNWGPSCGWATTVSALRYHGLFREADWIRKNRYGGTYAGRVNPTLDKLGLKYAYTTDGDMRLIDWCIKTRRPCGVAWYPGHATLIIGEVIRNGRRTFVILDNNHVEKYTYVERSRFMRGFGGWAWAFVYKPPLPTLAI